MTRRRRLSTPQSSSARVYRELGRRSAAAMAAGNGILVDATFRRGADRDAFREGWAGAGARDLRAVRRTRRGAPRLRALAREHDPARISDAGVDVVEHELSPV